LIPYVTREGYFKLGGQSPKPLPSCLREQNIGKMKKGNMCSVRGDLRPRDA